MLVHGEVTESPRKARNPGRVDLKKAEVELQNGVLPKSESKQDGLRL